MRSKFVMPESELQLHENLDRKQAKPLSAFGNRRIRECGLGLAITGIIPGNQHIDLHVVLCTTLPEVTRSLGRELGIEARTLPGELQRGATARARR